MHLVSIDRQKKSYLEYINNCFNRFNYYSGLVKSTDQEIMAFEKSLLLTVPQRRGGGQWLGSGRGERAQGSIRVGQGADRELWARAFLVEPVRQGKQA